MSREIKNKLFSSILNTQYPHLSLFVVSIRTWSFYRVKFLKIPVPRATFLRVFLSSMYSIGLSQPLSVKKIPFVTQISGQPLGALLSLSAGALIYVGATHLLPEAEDDQKKYSILALAAGVMAAVVIVALKP